MKPDAKAIEKLKAEHGEIYAVEVGGITLIVRPPTRAAFRRFFDQAGKESSGVSRYAATENLLLDCVVWPPAPEFGELLERKPGLVATVANYLVELAGAAQEAEFRAL